jgi:hypothetical protein
MSANCIALSEFGGKGIFGQRGSYYRLAEAKRIRTAKDVLLAYLTAETLKLVQ